MFLLSRKSQLKEVEQVYTSLGMFSGDDSATKWIRVNEKKTLHDVLREPRFIIPGIPGAYLGPVCFKKWNVILLFWQKPNKIWKESIDDLKWLAMSNMSTIICTSPSLLWNLSFDYILLLPDWMWWWQCSVLHRFQKVQLLSSVQIWKVDSTMILGDHACCIFNGTVFFFYFFFLIKMSVSATISYLIYS